MNRISGILRAWVWAQGGGRLERSQRQFVDIKQRQQHLNKFTRRLIGHCAIGITVYLINQTPGKKLRHGVALRASAALIESCKLLSQ